MRSFLAIIIISSALANLSHAQSSVRDSAYFDFWVGEWDLWWYGKDSVKEFGTNSISKILDKSVIEENFKISTGTNKGFQGKSLSVLDSRTKKWKQTWVDNSGGYLPFTGGMDGDNRYFGQEFEQNGKIIQQKMVFHSITPNSFVWDWSSSKDGGKTWNLAWRIYYTRRP